MQTASRKANIGRRDWAAVARDCGIGLLACEPGRAREYLAKLQRAESQADFAALRLVDDPVGAFERMGSVAILRLDGLILHRKPWWSWGLAVT